MRLVYMRFQNIGCDETFRALLTLVKLSVFPFGFCLLILRFPFVGRARRFLRCLNNLVRLDVFVLLFHVPAQASRMFEGVETEFANEFHVVAVNVEMLVEITLL